MKRLTGTGAGTKLVLVALFASFIAGFTPTLNELLGRWTEFDEAYGHGLLVVGIILWLFHERRHQLASTPAAPVPAAAMVLVVLSLVWLIAHAAAITIVQQLLLPLILLCAWFTATGPRVTARLLFPTMLFYFAIPVWDYLNDTLVNLTVAVVRTLLPLWHISALIEGTAVHIPSGIVVVGDGCSGLRYVITGSMLSTLAAWLGYQRLRRRLALIAMGIALSLIANWIRVFSLILIGHYTQMQSPLMKEHDHYGWLVFLVVISPVFIAFWRSPDHPRLAAKPASATSSTTNTGIRPAIVLLAALAMLAGPLLAIRLNTGQAIDLTLAPPTPAHWQPAYAQTQAQVQASTWQANLPPPYQQSQQSYVPGIDKRQPDLHQINPNAANTVTASLYVYRKDEQNTKLLPYISSIQNKRQWRQLESTVTREASASGAIDINQLVLHSASGDNSTAIWYWFDVGGHATASYAQAKLLQIPAGFSSSAYALVVVLESSCPTPDCASSKALLRQFVATADLRSQRVIARNPMPH